MAQTVVGIFESSSKAQEAVQELVEAGITRDRIDVSSGSNATGSGSSIAGSGSDITGSGSSYSSSNSSYSASNTHRNDDDHESGISKFFRSLFGSDDDDANKYTRVASNAQSIVTVHAQSGDEAEKVADILDDNGAVDVDEHAAKLGYNSTGSYSGTTGAGSTNTSDYSSLATDTTTGLAGVAGATGLGATADYTDTTGSTGLTGTTGATGYTGTGLGNDTTNDETKKIPVIEENLQVGKREVTTGGVRVRSRIVERPVEESVRLREESVNVERNTVDRPATDADLKHFEEKNIEMIERAEVPVVNKEARVVEEVNIAKNVEERNETVKDTVRKTEVEVENIEKDDFKNRSSNSSNTL